MAYRKLQNIQKTIDMDNNLEKIKSAFEPSWNAMYKKYPKQDTPPNLTMEQQIKTGYLIPKPPLGFPREPSLRKTIGISRINNKDGKRRTGGKRSKTGKRRTRRKR